MTMRVEHYKKLQSKGYKALWANMCGYHKKNFLSWMWVMLYSFLPRNAAQTQGASEQHSLMTTKYSVIRNNKQVHNNNNIDNKIISFRSLRFTFIAHN